MVCRAKDPATCWKHGNPTIKSLKSLFDPYTARTIIRAAEKANEIAYVSQDAEAYVEARGEAELAQLNYDASVYGLADIDKKLNTKLGQDKLSYAERIDLEMRKENALSYRESLLRNDANTVATQKNIAYLKKTYGVKEYDDLKSFYEDRDSLNQLPYGTPVLVETENGYFLDRTGGGEKPGVKRSRLSKLLDYAPHFVGTADGAMFPNYAVCLASSGGNLDTWTNNFKKITILNQNVPLFSSEPLAKYWEKLETFPFEENGRYAVTGNGFYYEFEGRVKTGFNGFSLKSPKNDVNYDSYINSGNVIGWYMLNMVPRLIKQ